jgi:hypothetical protein
MRGPGSDEADIITVEQRERRGAKKSSGGILNWMSGSGAPKKRGSKCVALPPLERTRSANWEIFF